MGTYTYSNNIAFFRNLVRVSISLSDIFASLDISAESWPGARKRGCTVLAHSFSFCSHMYTHACRARWCDVARMGARTHGGPTGSCGLNPTIRWDKKGSLSMRRRDDEGICDGEMPAVGVRGKRIDIITAWLCAITESPP